MVGKTVGKYRIVEKLGRGGMGVVYKAVDETLDREVAIKVFSPDLEESDVMKRFRAEATTLAKLNHPEIATIYELYPSDADLLMVMEYVRGETLEKLSQRSGPLPPERAAYLVAHVLAALHHAHKAGIVHRDLKPANVMVNVDGQIKVMDFGIARVLGAEHMTHDGLMMGTPAYMAPEQVLGQEVDPRADIYAVGVVFYRLLTGTLPFRADTAIGMVQKQVSDLPTPIRTHRTDLPEWCERAVNRALEKDPANRFQTAEEFRQALLGPLTMAAAEQTTPLSIAAAAVRPPPGSPTGTASWLATSGGANVTPATPTLAATAAATTTIPSLPTAPPAAANAVTRRYMAIGGAAALVVVIAAVTMMRPSSPLPSSSSGDRLPTSAGSAPRSAGEPIPGEPPRDTSLTFPVKALVKDGEKNRERDAKVTLAPDALTVWFHDDRIDADSVLYALPYKTVVSVSYSKSKEPLWNAPEGPAKVLHLDAPFGFFKGERHWLSLRTADTVHVLRLESDDVSRVLPELERRSGHTAERLSDK